MSTDVYAFCQPTPDHFTVVVYGRAWSKGDSEVSDVCAFRYFEGYIYSTSTSTWKKSGENFQDVQRRLMPSMSYPISTSYKIKC